MEYWSVGVMGIHTIAIDSSFTNPIPSLSTGKARMGVPA